ncbi:hypothetical protein PSCFBP3800_00237 [Pseudomonas syringae group genomosp. 3]|uniref:Uncharacterized protein n=1 Tax=Pseudomonas syringae group genomosp. 3 TaxID=251701 RepID=A0A2K4W6I4_9PSED|nr:hypothetical protein CFBP6411_00131 [Pseudomonas syringae group genomosp. 3]SPF10309.1 hypothetical protein PSCFBP3800_00237 [Pseudomonas syringae group genomosp. 3]
MNDGVSTLQKGSLKVGCSGKYVKKIQYYFC